MDDENQEIVRDLERRIETLENQDEAEFGSFSSADYIVLVVAAVVLPTIALVLAA